MGRTSYTPEPEIVRELKHCLAWLTGLQNSLDTTVTEIEALINDKRRGLLREYLREYPNATLKAEDATLASKVEEGDMGTAASWIDEDQVSPSIIIRRYSV